MSSRAMMISTCGHLDWRPIHIKVMYLDNTPCWFCLQSNHPDDCSSNKRLQWAEELA